jgi:anti-sigma factor RsiW
MTDETRLRVQAWLDGELPAAEAAAVSALVEADAEAADAVRELRWVRSWLAAGELPRALPESREFFWSKVERAIEPRSSGKPEVAAEEVEGASLRGRLRWLVPLGLAAALAALLFTAKPPPAQNAALTSAEIDSPQEDSVRLPSGQTASR